MLVDTLIRQRSFFTKTAWIHLVERQNLSGAASVIASSAVEEQDLAFCSRWIQRIDVLPNGVDDEPKQEVQQGATYGGDEFVMLGRVSWKKGIDRAIGALAAVPNARLHVVGNDEESLVPRLRALSRRLGVAERVRFSPPAYGPEKRAVLAGAVALVVPSVSENFGNVVVEAMQQGTPVITGNSVGAAEWVREADAGLVLENTEEGALADAFRWFAAHPEERAAMGRRGTAVVERELTWPRIADRTERLYETIIAGSSGRAVEAGRPQGRSRS